MEVPWYTIINIIRNSSIRNINYQIRTKNRVHFLYKEAIIIKHLNRTGQKIPLSENYLMKNMKKNEKINKQINPFQGAEVIQMFMEKKPMCC